MTPRISILLPVYNGARFLAEQIGSILAQRFADFELLIVDDGSTDDGPAISAGFAAVDRRIRILPSDENFGHKYRLLQLCREARAPLLAMSDHDDVWDADKLAKLHAAIGDKAMAFGRSDIIDATGRMTGHCLLDLVERRPMPGDQLTLLFAPQVSAHAALMRSEIVTDMAFARFQPFDWLLALDATFGAGLVYVDDAIVYHRLHGDNQMNGAMADRPSILRRLGPEFLYGELQSIKSRRHGFVGRLEHIAYSPVVGNAARRMAARIGKLCHGAWFEPGVSRPFSNPELRAIILDALQPFAGPTHDWQVAKANIGAMTRAQLHPDALGRSAARIFGR